MTDKYAVIGNPIAHSKSPQIHKLFAQQTEQDISYVALEAPLGGFDIFKKFVEEELIAKKFKGCNVTVPFKHEAWRLGASTTRALDAQAVNTLKFENGKIFGDNTDGVGLVTDIQNNLKTPLKNKRILLIGAGGAAYGVLHPLLEASQASLVIYNRTLENALGLKKSVEEHDKFRHFSVKTVEFGKLGDAQFDVVINATSTGLTGSDVPLPPTIFAPDALAYEMMYGLETPFMKFALAQDVKKDRVVDGLGMLVEQAAEAFFIWRRVRPETAPVIAVLRKQQ
jgi:shikimate dehydrogenase